MVTLYCTHQSIDLRKEKSFHVKNCPRGTVGPKTVHVLGHINHSSKHNCDEVSKWRHLVGSSSSYPCQSQYDVGTGLRIMSRGYKHASNACSKHAKTQMACKQFVFKSYRPHVGPIETQGSCTATTTKSYGAHACYLSDVCDHSTIVYSMTHFINEYTVPCCRCDTRWMYKVLKQH